MVQARRSGATLVTDGLSPSSQPAFSAGLNSFPRPSIGVVFGASGGIGRALVEAMRSAGRFEHVIGFGRATEPAIDLLDEASLERAASFASSKGDIRLVIDATGFLHDGGQAPEKSLRQLDPA